MDDELKEFRDMFFEEAGENLQTLETGLLRLESAGDDDELLNGVFRAAHSIKGGAASFGLTDVSSFAHVMEGLLDQIRRHERKTTSAIASLLLRATDMLSGLMSAARLNEELPPGVDAMKAELEHARSQPFDGSEAPEAVAEPSPAPTGSEVPSEEPATEPVIDDAPAPHRPPGIRGTLVRERSGHRGAGFGAPGSGAASSQHRCRHQRLHPRLGPQGGHAGGPGR